MKKIFFSLAAALSVAAAAAQPPRHLDPTVVAIGKEPPRGDVVCHDTKLDAIRSGRHSSKYLQPLAEWTQTETDRAVVYKSRFKVPFDWIDRRQFLHLGSVSASFDVVVNGRPVAYSQTGSTPSEFDITEAAREGANELEIAVYKDPAALKLENSRPPAAPRIEGEAWVLSQPRMRVRDIVLDTRMEGTGGIVELGVILKSHSLNSRTATVYYELLSPRGEVLSEGHREASLDMRREDTVRFFANIPRITPWSHEEPYLYTLLVKTQSEGRFNEFLAFPVGFRTIQMRNGLMYLNGVPLRLSMRQFTPTSDVTAMRAAIEKLRGEGINALRLRGAPPSRRFYSLCDEMGVYLCNQADINTHLSGHSRKLGGNPSNQPEWEGAYLDRVMSMYHTSKNNPSVVMFSLAECSANGTNLYESYLALKAVERRRPVIYTDGGEWDSDPVDFEAMAGPGEAGSGRRVVLTPDDISSGRFRLRNTRRFTPLFGEAAYMIMSGKSVVSRGTVPVEVAPGSEAGFTIPLAGVREGKKFDLQIDIKVERPMGRYTPGEDADEGKKVFRDFGAPLTEQDKIVIESGKFPLRIPLSAGAATER